MNYHGVIVYRCKSKLVQEAKKRVKLGVPAALRTVKCGNWELKCTKQSEKWKL